VLRPEFERLEREFNEMLATFVECFRKGDCRRPVPTLRDALTKLDGALERIRESRILADQKLEVVMRMLELANRYQSMAEALKECGKIIQTLKLDRYLGDYAL
jgi:hypothetical protein